MSLDTATQLKFMVNDTTQSGGKGFDRLQASCQEATSTALDTLNTLTGLVESRVKDCAGGEVDCLPADKRQVMESLAIDVLVGNLKIVVESCEEGELKGTGAGEEANGYAQRAKDFLPKLQATAPELADLNSDAIPPEGSDDVATDEIGAAYEITEQLKKSVEVPMELQLQCNARWPDLNVLKIDSVLRVTHGVEVKRRNRKKETRGSCNDSSSRLFSFVMDESGILASKTNAVVASDLPDIGRVMALVECEDGKQAGRGKPCFIPTNAKKPVEHGYKKAKPGTTGVCLSEADPKDDLQKINCAIQALIAHAADVNSNQTLNSIPSVRATGINSSMLEIRSGSKWLWPVLTVGSIVSTVVKSAALLIEASMIVIGFIIQAATHLINAVAGFTVRIVLSPLYPLLGLFGGNRDSKFQWIASLVQGVVSVPLCIITKIFQTVAYTIFLMTYWLKRVAFFIPQLGTRRDGHMQGSPTKALLKCTFS